MKKIIIISLIIILAGTLMATSKTKLLTSPPDLMELSLKIALWNNPNNEKSYQNLADYYRNQGRIREAEPLLVKALEINPDDKFVYFLLGNSYRQIPEHYQAAKDILEQGIKRFPTYTRLHVQMAKVYQSEGNSDKAKDLLMQAIALNPKDYSPDVGPYDVLIELYEKEKKYSEGEAFLSKVVKDNPSPELYLKLAKFVTAYSKKGRAKSILQEAVRAFPQNIPLRSALAQYYYRKNITRSVPDPVK